MSDTVKKYYELVEEGSIDPNAKVPKAKTAFTLLTKYDIEDLREAVESSIKNFKMITDRDTQVARYKGRMKDFERKSEFTIQLVSATNYRDFEGDLRKVINYICNFSRWLV